MDGYAGYSERHEQDGIEGRLVSQHVFAKSWDVWEMHPHGSEVVLCVLGVLTLHQEHVDGSRTTIALVPGEYAVNPPRTGHTADAQGPTAAVFITAGLGPQHRRR